MNPTPPIRALLIGIDTYADLGDGHRTKNRFPPLSGAVRDSARMERLLIEKFSVSHSRIQRFSTASADPSHLPTYINLIHAFEDLTLTPPEEQILIHYSGHGARVPTLVPDLKGIGGFDECLVPSDISRPDARYIRDLELAVLIDRLTSRGSFVTLILDCCHAGGATRGPARARGLASQLAVVRPSGSLMATRQEIYRVYEKSLAASKGMRPQKGWVPMPKGYVCLAACQAAELAYEFPFEGGPYSGALTHWVSSILERSEGLTYQQLYTRVAQLIRGQFEFQNPTLEGEAQRTILGTQTRSSEAGVSVLQIDEQRERIQIGAGRAQGIGDGALVEIGPGMMAKVVEIMSVSSWALVDDGPLPEEACLDHRVKIVDPGLGSELFVGAAPGESIDFAFLKAIKGTLAKRSTRLVRWIDSREIKDLQLSVAEGFCDILDISGDSLPLQTPSLPARPENALHLVRRLEHFARYVKIRGLQNPDPAPYLANALTLKLGRLADDYRSDQKPVPEIWGYEFVPPVVDVGQWICLEIRNNSSLVLHIAVLNLQPDWGITQILPSDQAAPCLEIEPESAYLLPLQVHLPRSFPDCRDLLMVFAATEATDFRCLEQGALGAALPVQAQRHDRQRTRLENYLDSLLRGKTQRRSAQDPHVGRDWMTAQIAIKVRGEKSKKTYPEAKPFN